MTLKTNFSRTAFALLFALLALVPLRTGAEPGRLTVGVNTPGVKISPLFYGLMTEEINHAYDGGLYAELVQNRVFKDDPKTPVHWSLVQGTGGAATMALDNSQPIAGTALTTCLRLDAAQAAPNARVGVANEGYWGMPIYLNKPYRLSFYAKAAPGFEGALRVGLECDNGPQGAPKSVRIGTEWKKYTVTLQPAYVYPTTANRLVITTASPGTIWLNQVSLFPPTYKNRPNGNRIDLMEKLVGMKHSFLRLPGGNYLEGNTIAERFDWKKTLGPIEQRPGHQCPWGYRSTDGMGLLEFLEWCEDMDSEPVLGIFAGYALGGEVVQAGPKLEPFVQDALDEIEYITGGTNTPWGAVRAKNGHPAPFPLTYVEIGNEDFFDGSGGYGARYAQFYDALKKKYPKLQIIATRGDVKTRTPDMVDDHYYRSAAAMMADSTHYDAQSRSGPKIFVGEWASTEGSPTPTLQAALGDAAWLTGLERNSDLVTLEAYAPLLVNVNPGARQWGTNLIGYDAQVSYGSPSYYVQSMFARNRGDVVLPVTITQPNQKPVSTPLPRGKVGVGTWLTQAEFKDLQVTDGDETLYASHLTNGAGEWTLGKGTWKVQDGALQQTAEETDCRATVGDVNWADYTYTLKARKISGAEGFLILFHVKDADSYVWWNVGGWGNSRTALERAGDGGKGQIGPSAPVTVETGRWYDIRIEVKGHQIRCFLDGKLTTEAIDAPAPGVLPFYSTASRDLQTGEVIVKVVNTTADNQPMVVDLAGAKGVAKTARMELIAGEPGAVNSVESPENVAPRTVQVSGISPAFTHLFPAHSVTVLRVGAKK